MKHYFEVALKVDDWKIPLALDRESTHGELYEAVAKKLAELNIIKKISSFRASRQIESLLMRAACKIAFYY